MRKVAIWVLIAIAAIGVGFLLFAPAGGVKSVDSASKSQATSAVSARGMVPTSGKPVVVEFYTDS